MEGWTVEQGGLQGKNRVERAVQLRLLPIVWYT
jgi:hypothetical protein